MKLFRSFSVLLIIAASSSYALAEGGGDRTFARMEKARQAALAAYQADQKDQAREATSASKKALPEKHANC
jgi:type II secretory pathway pseudopilin PulG